MDYVHSVPGRLRIQSTVLRRNAAKGAAAVALARAISGVESAEVNLATGSLVIYHDPQAVSADSLLRELGDRSCIMSVNRLARRRRVNPGTSVVSVLVHALRAGFASL
jgi:hypothetical protein